MRGTRRINSLLGKSLGINIKRVKNIQAAQQVKQPTAKKDIFKFDISKYLKELDTGFMKSINAPQFVNRSGNPKPLHIAVNKSVRAIRLDLPKKDILHLHSIAIYEDSSKQIDLSNTHIVVSSQHEKDTNTETDYIKNLFDVDSKNTFNIHTSREESPWIIIQFPYPTHIGSIVINNVANIHSIRATGLEVSITNNLRDWDLIYELGGLKNYNEIAKNIAIKYDLFNYNFGSDIFYITKSIVSSNSDPNLYAKYKKIPDEYKPILRSAINKIVMPERRHEYTNHGIKKTFRYYTLEEKRNYIQSTMKVVNDLKGLSKDVCLGFGSVIAVVRDKDLIPHDDDMDIIIGFRKSQAGTILEGLDILESFLINKGYEIRKRGYNHCYVIKGSLKIDVFVGIYDDNKTIGWFPGKRWQLKRTDMFPAKTRKLLNIECEIPNNYKKYLESVYGKNWTTPDPNQRHKWSNKTEYSDISGR